MLNTQKLDARLIGFVTTFEKITHVDVVDTFSEEGSILFVVKEGTAGRAIGKSGKNIKILSSLLKKKIKVIELNKDVALFIKRLFVPLEIGEVTVNEKKKEVVITPLDVHTKARIIGRGGSQLKHVANLVDKYFSFSVSIGR